MIYLRKVICISGTPGTGKTEVAKELCKILGANYISINILIKKGKIKYSWDKKRKTKIVDARDAERAARKFLTEGINVVDSHYSHLMKCDFCVILRTNPEVLMKRLKKRRWSKAKIKENAMAEILDEIASETKGNYIEIDTSKITPKKAAIAINKALNNYPMKNSCIDWTRKYPELLIKLGV